MARRRKIRIIDPGVLVRIIKTIAETETDYDTGLILRSHGPYGDHGYEIMYYDVLTPFGTFQFSDESLEPL
jgi:hypothetical protein